jgi:hypothetical protein
MAARLRFLAANRVEFCGAKLKLRCLGGKVNALHHCPQYADDLEEPTLLFCGREELIAAGPAQGEELEGFVLADAGIDESLRGHQRL